MYVYTYIMETWIWVNHNDPTVTSLEWYGMMVIKGNHPQMALFKFPRLDWMVDG